jgi:hypothetical protein
MAVDFCLATCTTYDDISVSVSIIDAIDINYSSTSLSAIPAIPAIFYHSSNSSQSSSHFITLCYFCNSPSVC